MLLTVGRDLVCFRRSVQLDSVLQLLLFIGAGSVSLWNIETAVNEHRSLGIGHAQPEPIEPQRRFQDGKDADCTNGR